MSLSPEKQRTLSRQQSFPELAVGLPPQLPQSSMMANTRSPSSRNLFRRSKTRSRINAEGDISLSDTSGDDVREPEWALPTTPVKASLSHEADLTPRRKVLASAEVSFSGGLAAGRKRDTLQARLTQAAKVKKSKSTGDGLASSSSSNTLPVPEREVKVKKSGDRISLSGSSSDKVVVCVRIKPTSSSFATTAYEAASTSLTLSDSHPNVQKRGGKAGREEEYTYTFDKLLQYPSTTPDLYEAKVAPLVEKAMNGFNSTIFAYGQTGSGKSFTMTGIPAELGIIPCAVDGVFDAINAEPDRAYLLRVSYIEIYNETLRDLLNFKKGPLKDTEKPAIHTANNKVYVEPLVEEVVSTPQDVIDLLERGNAGRTVGATDWNERSSRSHSVFTIVVESRPRDGSGDDDIRLSRLNLIDLAGSEKAVSDLERRGEGKYINRSLLALREVINKLTEKKRGHIPYRDSKLTHLLENALGGDSNICVICTLSAEEEHCPETLETLKFAGRCSQVETKAKKNVVASSERALIRAKDREIEELKLKLQSLANGQSFLLPSDSTEQVADLADSVAAMEARKAKLTAQLAKLNDEILTSEFPRSDSNHPASLVKRKRPRISDFTSLMMNGRIGVGSPKRVAGNDRRAVSGQPRLGEGMQTMRTALTVVGEDATPAFDHELTIAALRRSIAAKDEELAAAKLASSDHDVSMRALTSQLSGTRAEMVATIHDKAARMDELETQILELQKSREALVIEDQRRMEEVEARLKHELAEVARLQKSAKSSQVAHADEIKRLQRNLDDLSRQYSASGSANDTVLTRCQQLELSSATFQSDVHTKNAEIAKLAQEVSTLTAGRAEAERSGARLQEDFNRYRHDTKEDEAKVESYLKDELARLRAMREEAAEAARREKQERERVEQLLEAEQKATADISKRLKAEEARADTAESMVVDLKGVRSDVETKVEQLAEDRREVEAAFAEEKRRTETERKQVIAAKRALEEAVLLGRSTREQLDTEKQRARQAEKTLDDLQRLSGDTDARARKMVEEQAQLRSALVQREKKLDESRSEVDRMRMELLTAEEMASSLESRLQQEQGMVNDTETKVRLADERTKTIENKLQAERERTSAAEGLLRTSSEELVEIKLQLRTATTASRELEIRLMEELSRATSAEDQAHATLAKATLAETQLAELHRTAGNADARTALFVAELEHLKSSLEQETNDKALVEQELWVAKTGREEAESALRASALAISGQDEAIAAYRREVQALRQSLAAVQQEAAKTYSAIEVEKERADKLAKEVVSLNATKVVVQSTSSESLPPGRITSTTVPRTQLLTAASTHAECPVQTVGHGPKDTDEIERLEKIIEDQKLTIADLTSKVKFWSRELEQQREIVRALTSNANDSPPTYRASPRASHGKSKSIAGFVSPSASPAPIPGSSGIGSVHAKVKMPSTFTAFNLALPTSPSPLPMHPSQYDNRQGQRARRVTIEHDMDRLTNENTVAEKKALFAHGSPEMTPTKSYSRIEQLKSVPRQRRP